MLAATITKAFCGAKPTSAESSLTNPTHMECLIDFNGLSSLRRDYRCKLHECSPMCHSLGKMANPYFHRTGTLTHASNPPEANGTTHANKLSTSVHTDLTLIYRTTLILMHMGVSKSFRNIYVQEKCQFLVDFYPVISSQWLRFTVPGQRELQEAAASTSLRPALLPAAPIGEPQPLEAVGIRANVVSAEWATPPADPNTCEGLGPDPMLIGVYESRCIEFNGCRIRTLNITRKKECKCQTCSLNKFVAAAKALSLVRK
ncbi:hypothetical protein UY3_10011 [Chelonia mydas]|uniref:Uncharacterized protein n=1 Tax=Chelonia mydas TaxID=8469 RepID=M7BXM3_CHEMY|nr:hypothetical protein UY3_10011 [Chelonia mydas]